MASSPSSPSKQPVDQTPSAEIEPHFRSTPWAIKLFSDPTLLPFPNESRIVDPNSTRDTFMARTLATEDTIIAWQSFRRIDSPESSKGEIISVTKIGSGVNGHVDISHGGFVSLLLDEVIGAVADDIRPRESSTMTAYLNVNYKKPVRTPAVLLCRAWIEKTEGRKIFGKGTVEDGKGGVLATGEALFIVTPKITSQVKL